MTSTPTYQLVSFIVLGILLLLILFISIYSAFKKIKSEGFKSVDEWNEIQALTNIGVIISIFFAIISFLVSNSNQKISLQQSDENIALQYRDLTLSLTRFEYSRWESNYSKESDEVIITAFKGSNDEDLKCFEIRLTPIFLDSLSGRISDYNDKRKFNIKYSCSDPNVSTLFTKEKIQIKIHNFSKFIYAMNPENSAQSKWLNPKTCSLYGYFIDMKYFPSLEIRNYSSQEKGFKSICLLQGINYFNSRHSSASRLTEINWE